MSRTDTHGVLQPTRGACRSLALGLGLLGGTAQAQAQASAQMHTQPQPPRQTDIVVTGERADEPDAFSKLPRNALDVPQSISAISADEIERRGVNTLSDALRTVPGISLGAGETSWQGNNLVLRGFTTRNDMFLDGMRDYGYYYRDPFNDSSVEVLKGPSSVVAGRGATGGIVSQTSKTPVGNRIAAADLAVGTDGTRRATFDVGVPLGASTALRINGMAHRSEVAERGGGLNRRWGVAPSLGLGRDTPTRLTLAYFHQSERNRPDYGIPWFNGEPVRVSRDTFYGFDGDYLDTDVDIGTARLEHDVSSTVSLHAQARYSSARRDFRTSEAVIPSSTPSGTPLSSITVTRNVFSGTSEDRFLQGQLDATASFSTGGLSHRLVLGIEAGREHPTPIYVFHVGVIGTRLVDPQPQVFAQSSEYVRLVARTTANTRGAYAIDTVDLGDHVQALMGLRWDDYDARYRSTGFNPVDATIATTDVKRDDRRLSGRGALIYKPDGGLSLYVTYANSFNPSAEGIESLVSAGRTVAQANLNARPETSRIFEGGAKRSFLGGGLLLSAAIFRTVKSDVRIPNPAVSGFNVNGGSQRVRGLELEANGRLTQRWSLHAGYALLDSATLKTANPTAAGSPRIGESLTITPKHSGSVQTDYAMSSALVIGGGAIYQSSRLAQNTNASVLRAPGYVVFELRGRLRIDNGLYVQGNLYNLTDRPYYDQLHPFHVVPGAGRSLLVSLVAQPS